MVIALIWSSCGGGVSGCRHSRVTHPIKAGIVAAAIALAGLVAAGVFMVLAGVVAFCVAAAAAAGVVPCLAWCEKLQ